MIAACRSSSRRRTANRCCSSATRDADHEGADVAHRHLDLLVGHFTGERVGDQTGRLQIRALAAGRLRLLATVAEHQAAIRVANLYGFNDFPLNQHLVDVAARRGLGGHGGVQVAPRVLHAAGDPLSQLLGFGARLHHDPVQFALRQRPEDQPAEQAEVGEHEDADDRRPDSASPLPAVRSQPLQHSCERYKRGGVYDDSVPVGRTSMRVLAAAGVVAVLGWGCSSDAPRDTTRVVVGLRYDYPTPNELIVQPTLAFAAINSQMFLSLMKGARGLPRRSPGLGAQSGRGMGVLRRPPAVDRPAAPGRGVERRSAGDRAGCPLHLAGPDRCRGRVELLGLRGGDRRRRGGRPPHRPFPL